MHNFLGFVINTTAYQLGRNKLISICQRAPRFWEITWNCKNNQFCCSPDFGKTLLICRQYLFKGGGKLSSSFEQRLKSIWRSSKLRKRSDSSVGVVANVGNDVSLMDRRQFDETLNKERAHLRVRFYHAISNYPTKLTWTNRFFAKRENDTFLGKVHSNILFFKSSWIPRTLAAHCAPKWR